MYMVFQFIYMKTILLNDETTWSIFVTTDFV